MSYCSASYFSKPLLGKKENLMFPLVVESVVFISFGSEEHHCLLKYQMVPMRHVSVTLWLVSGDVRNVPVCMLVNYKQSQDQMLH